MDIMTDNQKRLSELIDHHRRLYSDSLVNAKLEGVVGESPYSSLSKSDLQGIFLHSKSIFFDTHVEVVSGHHTEMYVRFESIAQYPELISVISQDMSQWVLGISQHCRIDGILVPNSDASHLALGIVTFLNGRLPLRIVLAPFNSETGRIGTDVPEKEIQQGQNFVVLNDVTTRGNCVSKLAKIVTDHGGKAVGMMVFARRDSGQFSFMNELTVRFPFYYGTTLTMPQWDAPDCPLCSRGEPLFSWKNMPFLSQDAPLRPHAVETS